MNVLAKKLAPYTVLLASQSPRRHQLLRGLDIPFEIAQKDVEESYPSNISLHSIPQYVAQKKFEAFEPEISENTFLITADTVVILNNQILQKPTSRNDARALLHSLSDNTHVVVTGVCFGLKNKSVAFASESYVTFAKLSNHEIDYYVDTYNPLDKAGAYGVQEWIGCIGIESITGSYYNIMGLPVQALYRKILEYEM